MREGRGILLTTRRMEEADVLAHRAGIMSSWLLTVGTVEGLGRCVACEDFYGECAAYGCSGDEEGEGVGGGLFAGGGGGGEGLLWAVEVCGAGAGDARGEGGIGGLFRLMERIR